MDVQVDQNLPIIIQFIIFIISYISNVFSSIAGGGAGLIQLPALILFGIPYYKALAIHKIATVALGIGGSIRNYKNIKKNFSIIIQLLLFGIPGIVLFGLGYKLSGNVLDTFSELNTTSIGVTLTTIAMTLIGLFAMMVALILYIMGKQVEQIQSQYDWSK